MIEVKTVEALRTLLKASGMEKKRVGFVPTMGALHTGHLSLIHKARRENDVVLVSIFVNPTQFNESQDYLLYPKKESEDKKLLHEAEVDFLWRPEEGDVYPEGHCFSIEPLKEVALILEGASRPGHFAGMLTVVMKLLLAAMPTVAYFGEKDYQQAVLVEAMAEAFFLPTKIAFCPIQREASGLPYSSRNARLNAEEKKAVEQIYSILKEDDYTDIPSLIEKIQQFNAAVEYLSVYQQRVFLAIKVGKTRLIDNFLKETGPC